MKPSLLFFLSLLATAFAEPSPQAILESPSSSQQAKAQACRLAGEQALSNTVPALANLVADPVLSTYARTALERIATPEAKLALTNALTTTDGMERVGVIQSLGALKVTSTAKALGRILQRADTTTSTAILRTLGLFQTEQATQVLLSQLIHQEPERRSAAAMGVLLAAEGHAQAALLYQAIAQADVSASLRHAALRGLILTKRSAPFLLEHIQSEDPQLQDVALRTLRDFPPDELAPILHDALATVSPDLQTKLVQALRSIGDPRSAPVVAALLPEAEGALRRAILQTLRHLGGNVAAETLVPLVSESEAQAALITLQTPQVDALLIDRFHSDQDRQAIVTVLGQRGSESGTRLLLRACLDPDQPALVEAALRALRPLAGLGELPTLVSIYGAALHAFYPSDSAIPSLARTTLAAACRRSDRDQAGETLLRKATAARTTEAKLAWLRLLAAIGYEPALAQIQPLLQDTTTVKEAASLLTRWPDSAPLTILLRQGTAAHWPHASIIQASLELVAKDKNPMTRISSLKRLQPFINSPSRKQRFLSLLGDTPHSDTAAIIQSYQNANNTAVREAAEAAWKRLKETKR